MTAQEVIAVATLIISAMATAIGVVWKRGENQAKEITRIYDGRLADKDKELDRAWKLVGDLRQDSALDRQVDDKLAATIQTLKETILDQMPRRR